jgi:nucleoside-diphosphate-sugar epimerase
MKILITGNLGYIGPVLVDYIKKFDKNIQLIGLDTGYFAHCLSSIEILPEVLVDQQIFIDIRKISQSIFQGVDAVIHLSAISNDPMGNKFEKITSNINYDSSLLCADMAALAGVKNFVFASSCSVYGEASAVAKKEVDIVNPLTAYAKSKIDTETALKHKKYEGMIVTNLRFATACGKSPRLRLDLVLNDFVYSAINFNKISILSDGTPWRPLIDVEDMAKALFWAANRDRETGGQYLVVNAGSNENNFKIKDLAYLVSDGLGGVQVDINQNAMPDRRSYKVDFSLFQSLINNAYSNKPIDVTIAELKASISNLAASKIEEMNIRYKRLATIEDHVKTQRLNEDLYWKI